MRGRDPERHGGREAAAPKDRRIRYRIGINIGDIVLEDGDIFGDGVNVAARLEGLAAPGGICVARNVYSQVEAKLDLTFELMGGHRVKNIAKPITVYRVLPGSGARRQTRPAAIAWALRRHRPAAIPAAVVALLAASAAGAGTRSGGQVRRHPQPSPRSSNRCR